MNQSDNYNNSTDETNLLAELADSVRLREGIEGITRAFWIIRSGQARSTHEWSRKLKIPVPVLAALRRELEKRDLLRPGQGLELSDRGRKILDGLFGGMEAPDMNCPSCKGEGRVIPPQAMPVLDEFKTICERRPDVDVTLDQSHATAETGIRKALLLLEKGLLGRSLFFVGDDDLISVACWLVRRRFQRQSGKLNPMCVVDIDRRYLDLIQEVTNGEIAVREYDVRSDLSDDLRGAFMVALTDPAYTVNALTAFCKRAYEALGDPGTLFLSMPIPDTGTLRTIQRNLLDMGWGINEIYPQFNRYYGASIHAHVSSLFICEKDSSIPPEKLFELRYTPFYTGEVRQPGGQYECALCGAVHQVGPSEECKTIQDLKQIGCAECGNSTFHRIGGPQGNPSEKDDSTGQ